MTVANNKRIFDFKTPGEALAFVEGVEFVNDSSIEVIESIEVSPTVFRVTVEDNS